MPNFKSPALYIDFARLPPPKVIEEIDFETLIARYRASVVEKNPRLAAAVALEQSPTNIILEAQAYGEMLVRARINDAARSVMLPFATGSDLDAIAARFNVSRLAGETDERLRGRILMAIESFATAGTAGAYIFHAMSSDVTIRDVSAISTKPGNVKVTIMNSGSDPVATDAQLNAVRAKLNQPNVKPLTDVISVASADRIDTAIVANVTLYPGPDASVVLADINRALGRLRDRIALLGRDLNRSAIFAALNQEGVMDVELITPATDLIANPDQCVWITAAEISIETGRRE